MGDALEVLSTNNNWYKITINPLSEGYVHSKYVDVKDTNQSKVVTTKAELRNAPNTSGNLLATLDTGEVVNLTYQTGDWFYVNTEKGNGYIHNNNLSATKTVAPPSFSKSTENPQVKTTKVASITTNILNVRQQPSINSKQIDQVYRYNTFEVLSELEDWVSIKTSDGSTGYLYKDYVDITDEVATVSDTSGLGQQVVNYAKQFLGNPYVWGGNSLTRGVDCSGFTQQIMKKYGISISRTSRTQMTLMGIEFPKKDLLPGDLVFFGYNNRISHVALYMGNNQIIHANNSKTGIMMNALTDRRMAPYLGATRVIK